MALRQLSVLYLAAASSFAVAIVLAQHPDLNRAVHTGAQATIAGSEITAVAINDYAIQPSWSFTKAQSATLYRQARNAMNPPVQMAQIPAGATPKPVAVAQAKPIAPAIVANAKIQMRAQALAQLQKPVPVLATPDAPQLRAPIIDTAPTVTPPADTKVAAVTPPAAKFTLAPQAMTPPTPAPIPDNAANAVPADHPPSPGELIAVTQHLRASLTADMMANFDLFLFVSKAQGNSVGQRMYVFQKQDSGDLVLLHNWPVSTGREKDEIAPNGLSEPSITPAGYYELDTQRMYVHHFSGQWRQPMPYAMFFNWESHGYQTGLAIHGASGNDIGLLGTRASAGCVRLAPENARVLFSLIKNNYKGLMPKFAYDKRTATMSNQGVLVHTTDGRLQMAEGYKVLVFIENYGGENVVAALF
ncbi:MAG TPA: L,D-transpeptidase family protein [Rhizomicrobium sp.]